MRLFILCLIIIFGSSHLLAQEPLYDKSIDDFNDRIAIRNESVKIENIYQYNHKSKNKDSILIASRRFDDSGNCIRTDEYNKEGQTIYAEDDYYTNNRLDRKVITFIRLVTINNEDPLNVTVATYEYDSAGNNISTTDYIKNRDNSKYSKTGSTIQEFDVDQKMVKMYKLAMDKDTVMKKSFFYDTSNRLSELLITTPSGKILSDYSYRYNDANNSKKIYDMTLQETLINECYYNEDNKLTKKIIYFTSPASGKATIQCEYHNHLMTFKQVTGATGQNTYMRYYYQ